MMARVLQFALVCAGSLVASGPFEYLLFPPAAANARNSEADILMLRDGRLMIAWSQFLSSSSSDWAPARIPVMFSRDDGRTWYGKETLQENIGKINVMCPDLLRLRSGKILFTFWVLNSPADSQVMYRLSNDDGKTWTAPKRIPASPAPMYWMNQHDTSIQLRSGRILNPLYFTSDYRVDKYIRVQAYYSDDEGGSWKASRAIIDIPESTRGAEEPVVVERKDGSILMLIRNITGHVYQSRSSDGGETWTKPEPTSLVAPRSPISVKRIPSTGDLLSVWNESTDKRWPLNVAVSKDDGLTWGRSKTLDATPGVTFAYTSIAFVKDQVLFSYYVGQPRQGPTEQESKDTFALKLKSVPVGWFYE
ncbi:MAG: exo-alpha-sialidase [Acidobacteria bacterium]|nr:exo-alpha-sialidase [Acidobacteriota bacterium]